MKQSLTYLLILRTLFSAILILFVIGKPVTSLILESSKEKIELAKSVEDDNEEQEEEQEEKEDNEEELTRIHFAIEGYTQSKTNQMVVSTHDLTSDFFATIDLPPPEEC